MSIVDPTAATRSQAEAEALLGLGPEPAASPSLEGTGEEGGFTPAEIRKAYGILETGGSEQTVAIVDAYNDPHAESDLQTYRKKYDVYYKGTETACTEANKCFKKVDQTGETEKEATEKSKAFPEDNASWSQEISLDLDMVSAVCPECKILLVEATNNLENLYIAEDEAVSLKATEVSNSWLSGEGSEETALDKYFDHEGIPITAAGGDGGYGVGYPAASPDVISVGGTTLKKTKEGSRGWEESVWRGSGSGCSIYETSKPEWQHDLGCANRTDNDVAAVANPQSPVSVYDSYEYEGHVGWLDFGGTSVATPIVAAVEAHASKAVREEKGGEAFYKHALFNVTSGSDGYCQGYLCNGEEGYNGPTGWGTPDGPLELAAGFHADASRATGLSLTGATLSGYVNPEGKETTYQFEYGKTTAYGSKVPASPASAGSGVVWKGVSESVSGLEKETTYHYRLAAIREGTTIYSADHTFTTTPWAAQTPVEASEGKGGPEPSRLIGVSCPAANACTAVGEYYNPTKKYDVMLAERWNGTEWKVQSTPEPSGAEKGSELYAVSCSSTTECTAVGHYNKVSKTEYAGFVAFAERWNGTEWKIQSIPLPAEKVEQSILYGVSCSSATACTATGRYRNPAKTEAPDALFAESWNGTEWKVQSTPEPSGAEESELIGVSCTSSTACTAVGEYYDPSVTKKAYLPLAERWNGTEWKIESLPNPTGAEGSEPYAVSCSSATACTAVGQYHNLSLGLPRPLAEAWNGTEWKLESTPEHSGTGEERLLGVACSSSTSCTASGQSEGEGVFAEEWNGTEWALQSTPVADEAAKNLRWEGLSCTPLQICTAVGYQFANNVLNAMVDSEFRLPTATTETATSVGDTKATLNATANPQGTETKYYFEYGKTTSYGSKTEEASAGAGTSNVKESKAITGLEPEVTYHFRIVATNSSGTTDGKDKTFTTPAQSWTIQTPPNPTGAIGSYLYRVSCSSSTACTSVGEYANSERYVGTLAERWNGTEWTVQTTPNPSGAKESYFLGIACASSTACTAVGGYYNSEGTLFNLAEVWNGTEWKIQAVPNPTGAKSDVLRVVSCTSSNACTAVGNYDNSEGIEVPLAERWNGTEWKVQTVPNPTGAKESQLKGVSCISSTACTADGYYENSEGTTVTLAEVWNGTEWKIQTTPDPTGAKTSALNGVSCVSSTACTANGWYVNSEDEELSFAESWNGTEWKVQTVPEPTGATQSVLVGVSCFSATDCDAIGGYQNGSGDVLTLTEHWNGTEWKLQTTPNPTGAVVSEQWGVSCSSAAVCTTSGAYKESTGEYKALAEKSS